MYRCSINCILPTTTVNLQYGHTISKQSIYDKIKGTVAIFVATIPIIYLLIIVFHIQTTRCLIEKTET